MRRRDIFYGTLIIIFLIIVGANINGINSFLSVHTDKTIDFDNSTAVVPETWNTTEELNLVNESKTPSAITNGYVYIDHWDNWPEDHITSISEAKFKKMEDGHYKILRNENSTLSGVKVSKQYFANPTKNTNESWNYIGVNYVFSKEDTNYSIQVHYFTSSDYNNTTFLKEVDDRIEDDMSNIHNNHFNGFTSGIMHIWRYISNAFNKNNA
jgi:hypothetical protein